jgi:hypothetical protein
MIVNRRRPLPSDYVSMNNIMDDQADQFSVSDVRPSISRDAQADAALRKTTGLIEERLLLLRIITKLLRIIDTHGATLDKVTTDSCPPATVKLDGDKYDVRAK